MDEQSIKSLEECESLVGEAIVDEWDPLGIQQDINNVLGWYRLYARSLSGMVALNLPRKDLYDHVWKLETEYLKQAGNPERVERFVDRLMDISGRVEAEQIATTLRMVVPAETTDTPLLPQNSEVLQLMRQLDGMPNETVLQFYEHFLLELTITGRTICFYEKRECTELLEGMKWLNEMNRRCMKHCYHLRIGDSWLTEEEFAETIESHIRSAPFIRREVETSIRNALEKVS